MPQPQLYERVAADLEHRIRSGEFPPGTRLPSRAQLRREFAHLAAGDLLSGATIDKAMILLRGMGLVETLPGVAVMVVDPLPPG